MGFDDLESVVDKLGEDCWMDSAWVKEKKELLKEGETYLKSDYRGTIIILIIIITIITFETLKIIECASSVLITIQRYELLIKTCRWTGTIVIIIRSNSRFLFSINR